MGRLLFLTSSFPDTTDDGVCGYVLDLAEALATGHGHTVHVIAPAGASGAPETAFGPVAVERFQHVWPGRRRLSADADIGLSVASSRIAMAEAVSLTASLRRSAVRRAASADVVISHWLVPGGAVGAALRRPHIAIAHGGDVRLLERIAGGRGIVSSIARRSRVVCVSRDLGERLEALAPGVDPLVIPMGAHIGEAPEAEQIQRFRHENHAGTFAALFLGRLVAIKGVDVLIEAASRVPDVAIWIAGDGPESDRLQEQARAATLRVSFLGRLDRRRRRLALAACDAVIVPSRVESAGRSEGTPVVCAESFAAGRPVIASRCGGIVDMVEHGHNGLLVAPEDATALAAAIRRLADDDALRTVLARNAADRSSEVTMAATASRFNTLMENELAR